MLTLLCSLVPSEDAHQVKLQTEFNKEKAFINE